MSHKLNILVIDETWEQIETLRNMLDAPSISDVVRRAIDLSYYLALRVQSGNKILVEGVEYRQELTIPGIN